VFYLCDEINRNINKTDIFLSSLTTRQPGQNVGFWRALRPQYLSYPALERWKNPPHEVYYLCSFQLNPLTNLDKWNDRL